MSGQDPGSVVIRIPGPLDLAAGRRLAELLRSLPLDGRDVEIQLPDAEALPVTGLAACVLTARRLRASGASLRLVGGAGVAMSVGRARLHWLLPVTRP